MIDFVRQWSITSENVQIKYCRFKPFETEYKSLLAERSSYESAWLNLGKINDSVYEFCAEFESHVLDALPFIEYNDHWDFISCSGGFDAYIPDSVIDQQLCDLDFEYEAICCYFSKHLKSSFRYQTLKQFEENYNTVCPQALQQIQTNKLQVHCTTVRKCETSKKLRTLLEERTKRLKIMDENIISSRPDNEKYITYKCAHCDVASRRKRKLFITHVLPVHINVKKRGRKVKKNLVGRGPQSRLFRGPFHCSRLDCTLKFSSRYARKRHMLSIHLKEKRFHCNLCMKKFRDKYSLYRHERLKHRNIFFECLKCKFRTVRKYNLKRHCQKKHQAVGVEHIGYTACLFCEKLFSSHQALKKHNEIHEAIAIGYNCIFCGFIKSENHVCSFECFKCKLIFSRKLDLKTHEILHRKINQVRHSINSENEMMLVQREFAVLVDH